MIFGNGFLKVAHDADDDGEKQRFGLDLGSAPAAVGDAFLGSPRLEPAQKVTLFLQLFRRENTPQCMLLVAQRMHVAVASNTGIHVGRLMQETSTNMKDGGT